MEFEFDKEMDALLRHAAQSESVSANPKSEIRNPKSLHLDADEISAFAENALPEKTRLLYTAHFADCDRCRKILANVIALNSETVRAEETKKETKIVSIVPAVPWYRRLFAAPTLAYAMGALVLVFAGLFAFTFLKNTDRTAEVSSVTEKPTRARGASGDGETVSTETTTSASGASMSNGGSMSNAAAMTNSMQSNSVVARGASSPNASMMSNAASASNASSVGAKDDGKNKPPPMPPNQPNENQVRGSNFADEQKQTIADKENEREKENNLQSDRPAGEAAKPAAPSKNAAPPTVAATRSADASLSGSAQNKQSRRSETEKAEVRKIGGKNFSRRDGVWYDAAYNGQSTTNVSRGSNEYRKLDSGLRAIAETLSGTVVVVQKEKAYRIQ